MIRLLDGSSGGGSLATLLDLGATYVPFLPGFEHVVAILRQVPVVTAILGPVVGLGAARSQAAHFSVIVKDIGQLYENFSLISHVIRFVAGPPLVEHATHEKVTKEELGGWKICATNGSVDSVAESEADAFLLIKRWLSYLPSNIGQLAPRAENKDPVSRYTLFIAQVLKSRRSEESLLTIVPRDRSSSYDVRNLVQFVVDEGSFFEFGENWGMLRFGCI